MRKTKYLNKEFDNGWKCEHVGVAHVTGAFYKGTHKRTTSQGRQNYYYLFVRRTSDGKFEKMLRLNAQQAANVWAGRATVEKYSLVKKSKKDRAGIMDKVGYYFI